MGIVATVVVPTFNRRESLQRTLEGLARQDVASDCFEVVVVSDGSTDDTETWLEGEVERYPFVLRLIRQENSGPARARNRGVAEARGEVVVFVDDDVEPQPGLISAHLEHHRADPRVAVIGPQSPDPVRRAVEPPWIAWEHGQMVRQYDNFKSGVWPEAGPQNFYTGNASVRRQLLLASGGFDETFGRQEDIELAYRMQRDLDVRFVFEPGAAALHRPSRTFESWARTPYAYGGLDVARAREGNSSWRYVWGNYHWRNALTRALARTVLPRPRLSASVRSVLLGVVRVVWPLPGGGRAAALSVLSAIYNVRYLEGARDAIGGWRDLAEMLDWPAEDPRVVAEGPAGGSTRMVVG